MNDARMWKIMSTFVTVNRKILKPLPQRPKPDKQIHLGDRNHISQTGDFVQGAERNLLSAMNFWALSEEEVGDGDGGEDAEEVGKEAAGDGVAGVTDAN